MNQIIELEIDRKTENMLHRKLTVPEGAKRLYIRADYPEVFQYNSYLLVFDGKKQLRLQKLLGYGKQNICIGEDSWHTTIGGVPGELPGGEWEFVIGIFTEYMEHYKGTFPIPLSFGVSTEPFETEEPVTEPIGEHCWVRAGRDLAIDSALYDWKRKYQQTERWYKGDFHTHTRLSDGKETVQNAMCKAKNMRLDFYLPTEHNLVHTGWRESEIMIVPSVELTTRLGHMNFFGITGMPEQLFRIMQHMDEDILDVLVLQQIREAKAAGWVTSINHPFLERWKWSLNQVMLEDVDCLEIINDPTYPDAKEANEKAIAFLDALWMDGHKIVGVGGSDSHNLETERYDGAALPSIPGDPATYVHAKGLSPRRLLKNLRAGHAVVTRYCEVAIKMTDGKKEYLPGDLIEGKEFAVRLRINGLEEKPCITMVSYSEKKGFRREEIKASRKKDGSYAASFFVVMKGKAWQWVRFEVRDKQGNFLAYVNPVYRNEKKSRYLTYGEVVEGMKQDADKGSVV